MRCITQHTTCVTQCACIHVYSGWLWPMHNIINYVGLQLYMVIHSEWLWWLQRRGQLIKLNCFSAVYTYVCVLIYLYIHVYYIYIFIYIYIHTYSIKLYIINAWSLLELHESDIEESDATKLDMLKVVFFRLSNQVERYLQVYGWVNWNKSNISATYGCLHQWSLWWVYLATQAVNKLKIHRHLSSQSGVLIEWLTDIPTYPSPVMKQ